LIGGYFELALQIIRSIFPDLRPYFPAALAASQENNSSFGFAHIGGGTLVLCNPAMSLMTMGFVPAACFFLQ